MGFESFLNIQDMLQKAGKQGQRTLANLGHTAEDAISESSVGIKDAAITVDRKAHKNPWAFLGGATLGGLLVGYFMGRSKKY